MKTISRNRLKEIVRETLLEDNEFKDFFKKALEKTGKAIPNMSDEEKKTFFNKIDSAWQAKGEKKEVDESESKPEYQAFFDKALAKTGKSIDDMSDEEKKSFFNKIDTSWHAKGEKHEAVNEVSSQLKKGTKVSIIGTQFKGKEGLIISNDMHQGQYLVQVGGKIKGFKPKDIEEINEVSVHNTK